MSDYLIELCGCFGKIAFDSYKAAKEAVQRGKKGRNSVRRDVYHCHHAGSITPDGEALNRRLRRD